MAKLKEKGTRKNPYYTIAHYAIKAGVSQKTIYRWIQTGELETTKLNGLTFVRKK